LSFNIHFDRFTLDFCGWEQPQILCEPLGTLSFDQELCADGGGGVEDVPGFGGVAFCG